MATEGSQIDFMFLGSPFTRPLDLLLYKVQKEAQHFHFHILRSDVLLTLRMYEHFHVFIWQNIEDSKLNVVGWTLDSIHRIHFFHCHNKKMVVKVKIRYDVCWPRAWKTALWDLNFSIRNFIFFRLRYML